MLTGLCNRIDDLLRAVRGDEAALNRFAEAEHLGVYLRHGRIYPAAIGQTHTSRLASGCSRSVQIDAAQLSERTSRLACPRTGCSIQ
jgi:hypothetical protein